MQNNNHWVDAVYDYDGDDYDMADEDDFCWYCHGEGWGLVGTDWDCTDGVNGPYDGDVEKCPNCHGSGKAEDCTFW
jgi:hypothetical protein